MSTLKFGSFIHNTHFRGRGAMRGRWQVRGPGGGEEGRRGRNSELEMVRRRGRWVGTMRVIWEGGHERNKGREPLGG